MVRPSSGRRDRRAGEGRPGATPDTATDDSVYTKPGLEFWRAVSLETGVFGWFGKSNIPNLPPERDSAL